MGGRLVSGRNSPRLPVTGPRRPLAAGMLVVLVLTTLVGVASAAEGLAAQRPNVLFLFADDPAREPIKRRLFQRLLALQDELSDRLDLKARFPRL